VVWFYNQRGGAENLIKEANNDAGLTAHPSGRFDVNGNHFQLAMLAYNLICRYRHNRFHAECRIMPGRCQVTLPGLALALRSQFDDKLNSA
jgi:hypothetical protein